MEGCVEVNMFYLCLGIILESVTAAATVLRLELRSDALCCVKAWKHDMCLQRGA